MSNRFRKQYRVLGELEKQFLDDLKDKAEELARLYDVAATFDGADKRHLAIAQTNLEMSVMFAVKAIT